MLAKTIFDVDFMNGSNTLLRRRVWQLIDPTSLLKLVLALEYGIAFPDLLMPDGKENPFGYERLEQV